MATIIIAMIVVGIVVAAGYSIYRDKKSGKPTCGCSTGCGSSCDNCPGCQITKTTEKNQ